MITVLLLVTFGQIPAESIHKYEQQAQKMAATSLVELERIILPGAMAELKSTRKAKISGSNVISHGPGGTKTRTFASSQEKENAIREQTDEIDTLKKRIDELKDGKIPHLSITVKQRVRMNNTFIVDVEEPIQVGDIGLLRNLKVIQVVDKNNALMERTFYYPSHAVRGNVPIQTTGEGEDLIWVTGVSTAGLIDDRFLEESPWKEVVFGATKTKTYETAMGTKTVCVLEPIEQTRFSMTKQSEPMVEPQKTKTELTLRTWTDATGKFTVEAAFIRQAMKSVTIRRADGKEITLSIEDLSEVDQEYLKSLHK